MAKHWFMRALLLGCSLGGYSADAQVANLLRNPQADEAVQHWRVFGDARVEDVNNERRFLLRGGGYMTQDITLPDDAVGQYVVFVGRASGGRVSADGRPTTGTPYLSGYMMSPGNPEGGRVNAYLSGQRMAGAAATSTGEWERLWGVFRIPPGTGRVRFFLQQAQVKGVPHDGPGTRFDDLGLYLFPTNNAAQAFAHSGEMVTESFERQEDAPPLVAPAPACSLKAAHAPELEGVRLGMSFDETLALFPRALDNLEARPHVERYRAKGKRGIARMMVKPDEFGAHEKSPHINYYGFRFFDDRLYSIQVEYGSPRWEKVDDFIQGHPATRTLPPLDRWQAVNETKSKYLTCDELEIRFFASWDGKTNYILFEDKATEKAALKFAAEFGYK